MSYHPEPDSHIRDKVKVQARTKHLRKTLVFI